MGRIGGLIGRHKLASGVAGFLAVGLAIFVVVWFQPQKIVLEKSVNEAPPAPVASASTPGAPSAALVASGSFRSLEHRTTGTATIIRLANGSHVLRFVDLDTSNGPDLRVYLSRKPHTLGWHDYGTDYVELGHLKGNRGSQNYVIPAGTDISQFRSAVIWCVRFKVGFGVAPLTTAA